MARSIDSVGGDVECGEKIDREPRMHIMADLSNEKFSLHLSQCNVDCTVFLVSRPKEMPASCIRQ